MRMCVFTLLSLKRICLNLFFVSLKLNTYTHAYIHKYGKRTYIKSTVKLGKIYCNATFTITIYFFLFFINKYRKRPGERVIVTLSLEINRHAHM